MKTWLISMALGAGLPAQAALVTSAAPTADAFVNSVSPDANFGGSGAMQITAAGNAKGEFETVLRFNAAAAVATLDGMLGAGQWTVDSVTLSLGTNFGQEGTQPGNPIFATIHAGQFAVRWMQNDDCAVARAKEEGEAAQCLANLRQWGNAAHLYANDHDGDLSPETQAWLREFGVKDYGMPLFFPVGEE